MDNAAIAAIRFGLGRTPGQDPADPAAWLTQQLARPNPGPPVATISEAIAALVLDIQDRKARKGEADAQQPAAASNIAPQAANTPKIQGFTRARALFRANTQALLDSAVTTQAPFHERLVWFWANHFTVSTRKGLVAPMIGDYVQTAIRPHVTGRFGDMLLAVMHHPAMLVYLDNAQSAGPQSLAGMRAHRGLNENLARECLELHTLSPAAGYTQADVTAFASILTGWSVERRQNPLGFRFRPGLAEPGAKTLLGRSFPEGEQGGIEALAFLANHPATHRHLALQLVTHFVADTPPPGAVRRIEGVLRDTNGDLGAAAAELVRLPEAWQPLTKFRTPQEFVVAAVRAAGLHPQPPAIDTPAAIERPAATDFPARPASPNLIGIVGGLGQPMFGAPLPNGWPDAAAEWAGPEALLRRIDWSYGFANRHDLPEPAQLAEAALGPLLSPDTGRAIQQAGSRRDAITLLLASPEFQRR